MKKSYLSQQIRLMSITTYDLMTDDEWNLYMGIINDINKSNADEYANKKQELIEHRRMLSDQLTTLIAKHDGKPRTIRLANVINPKRYEENNLPKGISWWDLKQTKQISEFLSEGARTLGLEDRSITFDKVIVKWKNLDILRQITFDGFTMPILKPDGSVEVKHYTVKSASAAMLRTDKVFALSDEAVTKTACIDCGMSVERINSCGGINVNKLLAYESLPWSATDVWDSFDIDEAIVVQDFETDVTGRMLYINNQYEQIKGINSVSIKHTDGVGVYLPGSYPDIGDINFMVRGPYLKGLLSPWDYIEFCKVHGVRPIVKDVWKKEHDLEAEGIKVLFFASQLKLWNYYKDWDEYKNYFKKLGCHMCVTNYEEKFIKDVPMNYQFLQQLRDMTDEEIDELTRPTYDHIVKLSRDIGTMLRTLKADETSTNAYSQALASYNELLREAYSKDTLRAIKKRMILDAKSGRLQSRCKRLYVIPDFYAVFEWMFLGIEDPKGLLAADEVGCKPFKNYAEVDVLRSPSLYFEHRVEKVSKNPEVYHWFTTNAIVTSCKSLISKVLQFDCDGDQLNVTADQNIITVAKRMIEKLDIVPLSYAAFKAEPEMVNRQTIFNGFKRAHEYSGIGEISNMLTRLWNRDKPDLESAANLTFYNNQVIDAAKTAKIIKFEAFPEVNKKIKKAAGSSRSRMPWFYKFSRNQRGDNADKKYLKANKSTMNRICEKFESMPNINMNLAGLPPFNWQMLMRSDIDEYNIVAIQTFCEMDQNLSANILANKANSMDDKVEILDYNAVAESIVHAMNEKGVTLEEAYPSITKYLFTGENADRVAHKQMYWRIFGDIAVTIINENLENCTVCENCKMKVPNWAKHTCSKNMKGFLQCVDCNKVVERKGPKQCRCVECEKKHRSMYCKTYHKSKKRA